jgi:hypothetical protein
MSPTVLFVAGLGRSGSTLIDRLLGQVPGFCSVGELVFLWERGLHGGQRCGCGEPLPSCPFWTEVGERAFGGWARVDPEAVRALQRRVDRNRYVPLMYAPWLSSSHRRLARRYAEIEGRVYESIAHTAGASVVVDSSKHVSTSTLLRTVPGVDLRIAHLVRDPRGVAFSWQRVVARPDVVGRAAFMDRIPPWRVSARWLGYNLSIDVLRRGRPGALVRYEDFVAEPRRALSELVSLAGLPRADLSFLDAGGTALEVTHSVSGNPSRFEVGPAAIRPDEQWRRSMPTGARRLVTALTGPALVRYGYPLGSHG